MALKKKEAFYILSEYSPKRVLHIGGYEGEEGEIYEEIGTDFTFVEPVPRLADIIRSKGYDCIQKAVGLGEERVFHIDSMAGSSFLTSPIQHITGQITLKPIPLSEIEEGYDTLVVDTEGTEFDVLKSGTLKGFKTIVCELRDQATFEGETLKPVIEEYLKTKGFKKDHEFNQGNFYDVVFSKA